MFHSCCKILKNCDEWKDWKVHLWYNNTRYFCCAFRLKEKESVFEFLKILWNLHVFCRQQTQLLLLNFCQEFQLHTWLQKVYSYGCFFTERNAVSNFRLLPTKCLWGDCLIFALNKREDCQLCLCPLKKLSLVLNGGFKW